MSEYYCDICDRTIKLKYINKHLNTRLHSDLSTSVVNRYYVKNPAFLEIEDIVKKHVYDYKKGLDFLIFYVHGDWILIILLYV